LPGINIILHIVAGVAGNYLYYKHVKKTIIEVRSTRTLQNRYPVLQEEGGVHKWAAVIFSIILVMLFVLLFASIVALIGKFGGITL
jgi:hypothetical protein